MHNAKQVSSSDELSWNFGEGVDSATPGAMIFPETARISARIAGSGAMPAQQVASEDLG
jgi:hypothetical protein